jgi:hypothetical protein
LKQELVELEDELRGEIEEIEDRWDEISGKIDKTVINPYKKNIRVELFGIAWTPFWRVQIGKEIQDVPGYSGLSM